MQDISDCLSQEAQNVAELRLAAKRAARAEAREIRMKELERQQKEIYQVQKKYYGLDTKWGDIEQWMEDSERYSHRLRRNPQAPDEDDVVSVGSRSSLRTNGFEDELLGVTQYRKSSRSTYYSDPSLASTPLTSKPQQAMHNGSRPSLLNCNTLPSRSQRGSVYDESVTGGSRRYSSSSSKPPSEYSCYLGSGSRASSRASSARASPVVEERPDKDFAEKGSRPASSLSATTLASLGGTSSRRGSGDTSISVDTEASIREIKDSLAEVEEKYKRSMVTNAQLDNEKSSLQYQVDTLREVLLELEEELAESRRQYEDKHKECERHKHEQNVLHFQLNELKGALEQREELLTKHGIALDLEGTPNGHSLEPHINDDSHDPSVKGASLGKTNEAEMKREEISSQGPQAGAQQNRKEGKEMAPEELSLNTESKGAPKEHAEYECPNDKRDKLEDVVNDNDNGKFDVLQTSSSQQCEGPQADLKEMSSEGEGEPIDEDDEKENVGKVEFVLDQNFSELDREGTQNHRDVSPSGSEVFQDALDFVEQTPNPTIEPSTSGTDVDKEVKIRELEVTSEKSIRCDEECSTHEDSVDQKEMVIASQSKPDVSTEESCEAREDLEGSQGDIVAKLETKESVDTEKGTGSNSDASCKKIEDRVCACDELEVGQKQIKDCKMESDHGDQENIIQEPKIQRIQEITGEPSAVLGNSEVVTCGEEANITAEGIGESVDTEEIKLDSGKTAILIGQSPQEIKNAHHDESENHKDIEASDAVRNECINVQAKEIDKSLEMENVSGQDDKIKESQEDVKGMALESDLSCSTENLKTERFSVEEDTAELKEHQKKVKTQDEIVEPGCSDGSKRLSSTQSVEEHQRDTAQNETLSCEGESSQEEEDSDNKEDYHRPSEKYPGESDMPRSQIGSSVDQTSSRENIHVEESTEKVVRMGKGKNKEDCVIS